MGFLFFPIWVWGSAWRPFGPLEIRYYLEYCHHVARLHRCRRRRAYAPTSNTAAHDNHKKINSWVSFSLYAYGAPLGGPSGRRSSTIIKLLQCLKLSQRVVERTLWKQRQSHDLFLILLWPTNRMPRPYYVYLSSLFHYTHCDYTSMTKCNTWIMQFIKHHGHFFMSSVALSAALSSTKLRR